jgi:hypothetical protein
LFFIFSGTKRRVRGIEKLTGFDGVEDVIGTEVIKIKVEKSSDGARWGSELFDQTGGEEELQEVGTVSTISKSEQNPPKGCDGLDDIQIRTKPTTSNPTQIRFVAFDLAPVETHHHSHSRNRLLFSKPDLLPLSPTSEFSLSPQTQPESTAPSRRCRYNELTIPLPLR